MMYMEIREVSIVALIAGDNKVLLEDRSRISRFGERYGFFGGSLEEAETKEDAAKRELGEELNYIPPDLQHIKTYNGQLGEILVIEHLFGAKFPGWGSLSKVSRGNGADLFTIAAMRELRLMPTHYIMLDDIQCYITSINR